MRKVSLILYYAPILNQGHQQICLITGQQPVTASINKAGQSQGSHSLYPLVFLMRGSFQGQSIRWEHKQCFSPEKWLQGSKSWCVVRHSESHTTTTE